MICPPTRAAALEQLADFVPQAGVYARDRNQVKPGHPSVSLLSPAIRHRLITEEEVVAAVLAAHPFSRVEKFIQEVFWRRYWKAWLSLRPQVWQEYAGACGDLADNPTVQRIAAADSGNPVIDYFANELVTSGYLHNHARMWFAAWWVHEARLPWQAGAAFFFRHLLDGDPASNTLSWRWIAGLQTPGKTYLARRANLEKYLDPQLLTSLSGGLEGFENPQPFLPDEILTPPITRPGLVPETLTPGENAGLWIHEEDLSVETSLLADQSFATVCLTGDAAGWERSHFPAAKTDWITTALHDTASRAEAHWLCSVSLQARGGIATTLVDWAKSHHLRQVAALRPEIGPLHDALPSISAGLARAGIRLVLIDRPDDLRLRPLATRGFFDFWQSLRDSFAASPNE